MQYCTYTAGFQVEKHSTVQYVCNMTTMVRYYCRDKMCKVQVNHIFNPLLYLYNEQAQNCEGSEWGFHHTLKAGRILRNGIGKIMGWSMDKWCCIKALNETITIYKKKNADPVWVISKKRGYFDPALLGYVNEILELPRKVVILSQQWVAFYSFAGLLFFMYFWSICGLSYFIAG